MMASGLREASSFDFHQEANSAVDTPTNKKSYIASDCGFENGL